MLLESKIALVTGASSGIGRAAAVALAKEGATVVVASRGVESSQQTIRMIEECGGQGSFIKTDVSVAAEVDALITKTVERFGRIDCAFNNAGTVGGLVPIIDETEAEFDRIMNVNLKGVWLCMKYEIRQMLAQGGGSIVNTSSEGGLLGMPAMSTYSASKHGVLGLTKSAALEYARANIRINAVCPSLIDNTLMIDGLKGVYPDAYQVLVNSHPIGRAGLPEEVAAAVVWLVSESASFVTGVSMPLDGGTHIA